MKITDIRINKEASLVTPWTWRYIFIHATHIFWHVELKFVYNSEVRNRHFCPWTSIWCPSTWSVFFSSYFSVGRLDYTQDARITVCVGANVIRTKWCLRRKKPVRIVYHNYCQKNLLQPWLQMTLCGIFNCYTRIPRGSNKSESIYVCIHERMYVHALVKFIAYILGSNIGAVCVHTSLAGVN